ncbi:hypothetical protein VA7868_01710 [Vibrio aerogenes CECT 7868]|uniref:Uncharacterized protein n=1 Tax=Vibrio aerogenes CECT 7868 TaxID=1216006 RepID=A0A1M5YGR4_9VIBR|nr:hypothetical protein VA7868_01710 [Vibrio aerogenes CECT 7868]
MRKLQQVQDAEPSYCDDFLSLNVQTKEVDKLLQFERKKSGE